MTKKESLLGADGQEILTGQKLFVAMNEIDEDMLEEAAGAFCGKRKKKRSWMKWVAVAASLVVVLSGGIVMANTDRGIYIKTISYMNEEVDVLVFGVDKVSVDEFKGDVHEVKKMILEQIKNSGPLSSWWPNHWMKHYDTPEEIIEYLGYEGLMLPSWKRAVHGTTLNVYGNNDGDLEHITMEISYKTEESYITARADIFTKYCQNPFIYSTVRADFSDEEYQRVDYKTKTDKECTMFITGPNAYERKSIEGYVVEDNVIYSIQFGYPMEQDGEAVALVKEWADSLK